MKKRSLGNLLRAAWREDRNPESLAKGLALGLFVAFLPIPAMQAVVAFALAHFLGANRLLAVAGSLITNIFTVGPIAIAATWMGSVLLPGNVFSGVAPEQWSLQHLSTDSADLLKAYLVGTFFFSAAGGALGYFGMKIWATKREQKRWRRIEEI